tara:strand:- start:3051 stop:3191 length:141 start_codon:yes stop_codon:yes gene_type:complete
MLEFSIKDTVDSWILLLKIIKYIGNQKLSELASFLTTFAEYFKLEL